MYMMIKTYEKIIVKHNKKKTDTSFSYPCQNYICVLLNMSQVYVSLTNVT